MHPIRGGWAVFGGRRVRDLSDLGPSIDLDGAEYDALMFVIGGRHAGDESRLLAGLGQIGLGHHRRIGNVNERILLDTMGLHVPRNLTQHTMIDRLVRGVAVLQLADNGYIRAYTQQR